MTTEDSDWQHKAERAAWRLAMPTKQLLKAIQNQYRAAEGSDFRSGSPSLTVANQNLWACICVLGDAIEEIRREEQARNEGEAGAVAVSAEDRSGRSFSSVLKHWHEEQHKNEASHGFARACERAAHTTEEVAELLDTVRPELRRKPKVGDIVLYQLLSVSRDGVKERPALVIGHDSLEGRLHLRGFFGSTDAVPGNSEADTFFSNYGHHPGDWHWPEEDES